MRERPELQEQVSAARDAKWTNKTIERLKGWSRNRAATVGDLLISSKWERARDGHERRMAAAVDVFRHMSEKDRLGLWERLFPRLAPHLEGAWQEAVNRPFQEVWERKPFRAPQRADLLLRQRARVFLATCEMLRGLDPDAEWLAGWGPHVAGCDEEVLGILLASALNGGGAEAERVRRVLVESINGEHEIGVMGNHATIAMLNSRERMDWEVIGKLLLAAQRQEGLRQSILEIVQEASPDAFRYFLGLVLEHDLARFSSVVRAFDAWLGMQWAGGSAKVVRSGMERLCRCFDDDGARREAIATGEAEDAYFALWVTAFQDADEALKAAEPMLEDASPERRFIAVQILQGLLIVPEGFDGIAERLVSGRETDPRLIMAMCTALGLLEWDGQRVPDELFGGVAKHFESAPAKPKKLEPIVWPWVVLEHGRRAVAELLRKLARGAPEKLIPYAAALETHECADVVRTLAGIGEDWDWRAGRSHQRKRRKLTPEARALVVSLTGDARGDVQAVAFEALEGLPVEEDEVARYLSILHRSAPKLRSGAIKRLTQLPAARALEVARELLGSGEANRQAAGLELAGHLAKDKKFGGQARDLVRAHHPVKSGGVSSAAADQVLGQGPAASLDDCLGLAPAELRTPLITPRHAGVELATAAAKRCLKELAELFAQHGETEIEVVGDLAEDGRKRVLLANAGWSFPSVRGGIDVGQDASERLPLCEVWTQWLGSRGNEARDKDGLELLRAWGLTRSRESYVHRLPAPFGADYARELLAGYERLVAWMAALSRPAGGGALLVQHLEDCLASEGAPEPVSGARDRMRAQMRESKYAEAWSLVRSGETESLLTDADRARAAQLGFVAMERKLDAWNLRPDVEDFLAAYDAGLVNVHDFIWLLLHPIGSGAGWSHDVEFGPIEEVSRLRPEKVLGERVELLDAVRRVRERLLEIELARGDLVTPASVPASKLRHAGGADVLFRLLGALGKTKIVRHHEWGEPTRGFSLSRLMSVTAPGGGDTPEAFAAMWTQSGLKPARMIEVAMFAPQWARHIEHAVGFDGLEEAVWWVHAHTKTSEYWREQDFREMWAARIAERSELEADDLEAGAVDVAWFGRVIAAIGEEGWERIQSPSKYASNSGGHKRAELFARAMLGKVTVGELIGRIDGTRHPDSVRALGLVPLPERAEDAKAETLRRYLRMQGFKRESRQFGSQRQASEGRAVEIGMQNLARTAGYRDPRRLQWAMEAEAVADLARGPVQVTVETTTVSLAITADGEPELTVVKAGKPLKSVPAKLVKQTEIAELRSRVTELHRQASRMRLSLEESMCRGDAFTGPELRELFAHPMLRPMLERLVFVGEGGLIGYPTEGGRVLRGHGGGLEPVGNQDSVRLAHPIDLLARGEWSEWQRECMRGERVQPFKQVFREVYPKTEAELDACDMTRRYAGHQVNPRQALALLKQRQWVIAPEEGVRKTFHDEGLVAELWFQEPFFTPAEIEGLTLEGVAFQRRKEGKRVVMADVPERVFTETMRDLDLVVSVAHLGGVDPEASASTVEMRATLLRETCQLLGLANVRVEGHHAVIDGTRASYSVHLGSATTRVLPGRMLVIVAVHSQYRGRLFLPFADNDPKTAEVMAKALLLARDDEIRDPSILAQIVG